MSTSSIYLDYAATTPISKRVAKAMSDFLFDPSSFGNPSSDTHSFGHDAQEVVQEAREDVSKLLGCKPRNILFTSGATESNNIIIQSVVNKLTENSSPEDIHLITSAIEHKSVLETFKKYEQQGFDVTYLYPDKAGLITPESLKNSIKPTTKFVSLMYVNNELGNITDIESCGEICSEHNILFHSDASQAVGKLKINISEMKIDFMSFSGHKFYGPKGVGGLYFNNRAKNAMSSIFYGGPQERGVRPGTIPTHQLVGIAAAARLAIDILNERIEKTKNLRNVFLSRLLESNLKYSINTNLEHSYEGIVNIHVETSDPDLLMLSLSNVIAVSTGSACNSKEKSGSYVLNALHRGNKEDGAHIRVSFGDLVTPKTILAAVDVISNKVDEIEELSEPAC